MTPPNFVLILTDTQGANVVGAYGRPELHTPNLDRLAQGGVRFERAYTTSPLCTPARAAIFSGMYSNLAGPWANSLTFNANVRTMGQRLQDNGYHTAYVGKWHLDAHDYFGAGICPPGWDPDYWYDARRHLETLGPERSRLWRSGLNSLEQLRANGIGPEFTMAHQVSNRAIAYLQNSARQPFLLAVSYDEPHHPHTCPPEFAERFQDYRHPVGPAAFDNLAAKPLTHRKWAEDYRDKVQECLKPGGFWQEPLYFGCNSFVDQEIGRVLEAVQAHAGDNTYIIFTSDHGAMLGAHQLHDKGPAMYEEITRVPLIVRGPGRIGAGATNDTVVSHVDILPTVLDLAGQDQPPVMPGRSLARLLGGRTDPDRGAVIEFNRFLAEAEYMAGLQPVRCLVTRRHKLVINLFHTDELYDLERDPAEMENRIDDSDYAARRDELHDRLLAAMSAAKDPFAGLCWEQRAWRRSQNYPWGGGERSLLADGYAPDFRHYMTGQPFTR